MTDTTTNAKNYLIQSQNADGGWAYLPGRESSPEPTIYATLAIWSDEGKSKRAALRGLDWLAANCTSNGALRIPGHVEDHWTSLLYLIALIKLKQNPTMQATVREWALKFESAPVNETEDVDLNGKLIGWGWVKMTFGWVEPTSYALIALKLADRRDHPRVAEGTNLLLDRACKDGGWNYGNREVLGQHLTSYLPTTALAAMALQGETDRQSIIDKGLDYLTREIERNQSALNLALTILCFDVYGRETDKYKNLLNARQMPDGSWMGNAHLTAVAALSLDTTDQSKIKAGGMGNIFRV
ncbi:MAG TPA: prenyltransferase/squalene oxidase repeat-containing protein [Blastocatellia bacterium]|nr:prenyltransferase/squalene oxidase repeat-containing protein [Blastocatellia bacterium]